MKAYVYCVTNIVNGKCYVGKTCYPRARWLRHVNYALKCLDEARGRHNAFYNAIRKHGVQSFKFEVISEHETEQEAFDAEMYEIVQRSTLAPNGYNIQTGGSGGFVPSDTTRAKMGAKNVGRKHTEEWKRQSSLRQRGRKRSAETCKNISKGLKGKKLKPEQLEKLRVAAAKRRGKKVNFSEEHRLHLKEAWARRKQSFGYTKGYTKLPDTEEKQAARRAQSKKATQARWAKPNFWKKAHEWFIK